MTTTNQDPEAIRREIDRTRGRLSEDVDVLAESVTPSAVARRSKARATDRASRLKETVMGTAQDKASTVSSTGSDAVHGAADAVTSAPDMARRQARGNPLAAGAVALAAGWLVGSLLPASAKERELASAAKEQAQPLMDEATSMAKEVADNLKEPAQEAVESVKGTAQEGVENVRGEGASAAQDVKDTAKDQATSGGGSGSTL